MEDIFFFEWFDEVYIKNIKVIKSGEKFWKTSRGEIVSIIPH